jgi:hypothetical protein
MASTGISGEFSVTSPVKFKVLLKGDPCGVDPGRWSIKSVDPGRWSIRFTPPRCSNAFAAASELRESGELMDTPPPASTFAIPALTALACAILAASAMDPATGTGFVFCVSTDEPTLVREEFAELVLAPSYS